MVIKFCTGGFQNLIEIFVQEAIVAKKFGKNLKRKNEDVQDNVNSKKVNFVKVTSKRKSVNNIEKFWL